MDNAMKSGLVTCFCGYEMYVKTTQDYIECPKCFNRVPVAECLEIVSQDEIHTIEEISEEE